MEKVSGSFLLAFVLLICSSTIEAQVSPSNSSRPFNRTIFPEDFIFGAGSSNYQIEGAYLGKGQSNWDYFVKYQPGKIIDGSNGDVAADFYHLYKNDTKLMKRIGLDSFRFSISWSRVLPTGRVSGGVNEPGVLFYSNLIDNLLSNGIVPFVTIFHWDVPQALEDEYGGFLNHTIVHDFKNYSRFLFETFGERVKNWCTVNEPNIFALTGYDLGVNAPGRCSNYVGNCTAGNSSTEPYILGHNLLLAHSAAVKLYKKKYQGPHNGTIGITIASGWYVHKFGNQYSRKAASRALDFNLGWFMDPITNGTYPETMRINVGDRLPKFNKSESDDLKGSFDFLGLNYYTSNYANTLPRATANYSYFADMHVNLTTEKDGVPLGHPTNINNSYSYARGLGYLLLHIKENYNNPLVYITENGVGDPSTLPFNEIINDTVRIKYLHGHLHSISEAINNGSKVKAYYIWSFLDDFEWARGYTLRYGITYVNFTNLERQLKASAYWFQKFLLK